MSLDPKKASQLTNEQRLNTLRALRGYDCYIATFQQVGTDNPVITVIENTLGVESFTKVSNAGGAYYTYEILTNGKFANPDKIFANVTNTVASSQGKVFFPIITDSDDNKLTIQFTDSLTSLTGKNFNHVSSLSRYYRVYIEIRVYF